MLWYSTLLPYTTVNYYNVKHGNLKRTMYGSVQHSPVQTVQHSATMRTSTELYLPGEHANHPPDEKLHVRPPANKQERQHYAAPPGWGGGEGRGGVAAGELCRALGRSDNRVMVLEIEQKEPGGYRQTVASPSPNRTFVSIR